MSALLRLLKLDSLGWKAHGNAWWKLRVQSATPCLTEIKITTYDSLHRQSGEPGAAGETGQHPFTPQVSIESLTRFPLAVTSSVYGCSPVQCASELMQNVQCLFIKPWPLRDAML
jgi:hypothetical protein